MKKLVFVYFGLASLFVFLNACNKSSANFNQNEKLLSNQSWIVVSIRQNTNNGGWVDIFSALPTCKRDNRTFFKTDYSIIIDEGITKCNGTDPQSNHYGAWSLSTDGEKITTTNSSGISTEMDVHQLDNSNFTTFKNYTSGTDTVMIETRYIH
ncbi:MAG: hypothetical protein ABIN36_10245 [Ferruginibacter sp.]